jgi:hypothetical protein
MGCRTKICAAGTALSIVLAFWMPRAHAEERTAIHWQSGVEFPDFDSKSKLRGHVIIQFDGAIDAKTRAVVERNGVRLLSYLSHGAWFARLDERAAGSTTVPYRAAPIKPEWKLHPLLAGSRTENAIDPGRTDAANRAATDVVYVQFFDDVEPRPAGRELVLRNGGRLLSTIDAIHTVMAEVPVRAVFALAQEDAVQWIEPALPPLGAVNDGNRELTGVQPLQGAPYNLSGAGVRVLLYDSGIADASHPDFGGRLIARETGEALSHATHVAGTIGGSGADSEAHGGTPFQWRGMAPGVTIESFEYDPTGADVILHTDPGDIALDYGQALRDLHVDLSNNSLSTNVAENGFPCELEGDYGIVPALIDGLVRGSGGAPLTIVWAGGNERSRPRCGANFGTIPPPATAKNTLVVGAVRSNDDVVATFSSWGPTDDGRLRPDLCAPGAEFSSGVTSTEVGGGYTTKAGTSMAAPTVTGVCALLIEDYRRTHGENASLLPSTVKAILTHTAADRGDPGPDYSYGYGSMRARDAIDFQRGGTFLEDSVEDGQVTIFLVEVSGDSPELKSTLAWDDVPGTPNVVPALINDLDLYAVSPSGELVFPWTLDPAKPDEPPAQDGPDRVNNVEQVYRFHPEPGIWTLYVSGHSVPSGPQRFSLAATPRLSNCSSEGKLVFTRTAYRCDDTVDIVLADCDLNINAGELDSAIVHIASDTDPEGVELELRESDSRSGVFAGGIRIDVAGSSNALAVSDGDTLTVAYLDTVPGQLATATASVICGRPTIESVSSDPSAIQAMITFTTDRPCRARVVYGQNCVELDAEASSPRYETEHQIRLVGLDPETLYFFVVAAEDSAHNSTIGDNGGTCFSFITGRLVDYYSELFHAGETDIENCQLKLVPDNSLGGYAAHFTRNVFQLPTDTGGGNFLTLSDDDSAPAALSNARTIALYGERYSNFNVGSNGYIDFGTANTSPSSSFGQHFSRPAISALRMDLDSSIEAGAGFVSWKELDDHVAVTWDRVQEWDKPGLLNTAQARLFYDGRIELTWLNLDSKRGLCGISAGRGEPTEYRPSDLSSYPPKQLVLHPIGDQIAQEGTSFSLRIGADSPIDTPVLSARDLPAGASFEDLGGGSGRLLWDVPPNSHGIAHVVTFEATDGVGTVTEAITIHVELRSGVPPTATALAISPEDPTPRDSLTAHYEYDDPEGRPEGESLLRWFRNDVEVPELLNQRVAADSYTEPDDAWYFTIQPSDGTQLGDAAVSPTVRIQNPMDLNRNGRVDAMDVQRMINAVLGLLVAPEDDVDGNGAVDAVDLMLVLNYALRN